MRGGEKKMGVDVCRGGGVGVGSRREFGMKRRMCVFECRDYVKLKDFLS